MIITKTPFRITLGGGGTDLPSFYADHGGFVFAMCINKYMYLLMHRLPVTERKTMIRYSQVETVDSLEEISHPLAREALLMHDIRDYIEVSSIADMPAKTGLGSSGAYLVGLLTAIRAYKHEPVSLQQLAEEACHIEMNILKEPVGKQDQYMAAFGGFRTLEIHRDGSVKVASVPIDFMTSAELVTKARVYYTGLQRSATAVLQQQNDATRHKQSGDHKRVVDCLCRIKEIGYQIRQAFLDRDLDHFGRLMDEHWSAKKAMSSAISLSIMDELYETVKKQFGVLGGKLIGAGGGGFVMLYCPDRGRELDEYMASRNMPQMTYFPAMEGASVVADFSSYDEFSAHHR